MFEKKKQKAIFLKETYKKLISRRTLVRNTYPVKSRKHSNRKNKFLIKDNF